MVLHDVNFTGFAAIRAIIFAIHAKTNAVLPLTVAAVAIARTFGFWKIALRAEDYAFHIVQSPSTCIRLPLRRMLKKTIGHLGAPEQAGRALPANGSSRHLLRESSRLRR